ncbi:MAG: valine--tRNA ligase [Candidatus Taylorbacteria bacterium RIFCSPHIGHO2_02_FULL_46_13]|uniref:Valine--tRNA ligase n=1 Tax=Candidatus Taylorbacteria bacterium RIFCSPHIGHO2_02_FULL_46_13 TaxID=1802312 RepID=A0A1G2MSG7_9BACT|nr:MAG: valine--tRNA ligase [Candidatus Taylorbacteria bacterium RIFCSPHIGHO2_02_FULL_46_13]
MIDHSGEKTPPNINERLLKPYNCLEVEDRIYKAWEEGGYFNPDVCIKDGITDAQAEYFSMVLPPPNVTGSLHMGSAFMLAIEDVMVRFARMRGKRTLWIPGTDHAAIATQTKVEGIIYKEEKKRRHDLGRQEFLKRVETFASESHDTIVKQIRKMGCSIDWSREAFTLDEKRSLAVKTAFKRMYDEGLIYRAHRIVNWDPKGQTTISDDELVYKAEKTKLYTFRYAKNFPIAISTTRPETKVGDTAVAVHPSDTRYQKYVGKEYDVEFAGVSLHIKVVADETVESTFGTGAVGVTPAHSQVDWEIAERHHLPLIPIIDEYARMTVANPHLNGKKVAEARQIVVDWLTSQKLIEKEEEIEHNVATAERTGGMVEPLPKLQWFVNVNAKIKNQSERLTGIRKGQDASLKELMLAAVKSGQTKIIPDRFEKVYFNWVENLRDWCVSRQIWYGHQIPVWYKGTETYCDIRPPQGDGWTQDSDTLDTWFSSGLWTFSTLGWPATAETAVAGKPGSENDFANYHPTIILETAYDILFFWVARMILMSTYLVGDIPFKAVYLHGIVRDKEGRKISKSLGNNTDPLEVISKYGADAMRMSLLVGTGPGNDSKISEEKLKAYKHFANKLWNIARFVFSNTEHIHTDQKNLGPEDLKKLEQFRDFTKETTDDLEHYRFYLAAEKIYHYLWHTFADILIEETKPLLFGDDGAEKISAQTVLRIIFNDSLKLLHPFMPFITEEIWSFSNTDKSGNALHFLMVQRWPQ